MTVLVKDLYYSNVAFVHLTANDGEVTRLASLHGDIADTGAAEETLRMLPLPPRQKRMILDYMANIIFTRVVSELECKQTLSYGAKSDGLGTCYNYYWQNEMRRA